MEKFIKIAQSLANLYDLDIIRLDIMYITTVNNMSAFLTIGHSIDLVGMYEFEIKSDGSFKLLR